MIIATQLRAARSLLTWDQKDLAEASGVSLPTIKRMEASDGEVRGTASNVWKVQRALEGAGIIFIDENGGGPGVRLRKPGIRLRKKVGR